MNLRSRSSTTNDRKRAVRLSVESLESRRLLAGLQVSVFLDNDGSRIYEPSIESPAVDRLVYVDLNESGGFDPGEPVAVTDLQGLATFDGLDGDDYSVGLISNPQSQLQTSPVRLAEQAAVIGPGSESLLASTDLSRVWNVDGQGVATQYSADGSSSLSVDLGGPLVSSTRSTSESIWLVIDGESGPLLKSFDPSTGEILEFDYPLAEHQGQITEIVSTSAGIVGLIETLSGSRFLARFQDSLDGLEVAELSTTDATSIAGASQSAFVVVSTPQTT